MHLTLATLILAACASAAPLSPIQQLLAASNTDDVPPFHVAEATMHAVGSGILDHLTVKGRERLEINLKRVEENHLREELTKQDGVARGMGLFAGVAPKEDEIVLAHPPTPVVNPNKRKGRTAVRLAANVATDGVPSKMPSVVNTPALPTTRTLPQDNTTPFFSTLRNANLRLTSSESVPLHIQGEVDEPSICTETMSWMSLPNSQLHDGFWNVPVESIRVNGLDIQGPFDAAIFDAASNRIAIPPQIADQVYGFIPFASPLPSTTDASSAISYSFPCDELVSFSLTFADQVHVIDTFSITPLASVEGAYCLGAVYGLELLGALAEEATHGASEILI